MDSNSQVRSIEERLNFYLNEPQDKKEITLNNEIYQGHNLMYDNNRALFRYEKYKNTFCEWYCSNLMHRFPFRKLRSLPYYEKYRNLLTLSDFINIFHNSPQSVQDANYLFYHGEKELNDNKPYIRKARKTSDKNSVLFKLSTIRHFFPCMTAQRDDTIWNQKKGDIIWRGATTSAKFRNTFVFKYYNKFDIGFSSIKQFPDLIDYKKETVSIKEQLHYKFIVSLEGYDLASNLKWVLYSNSVPIMPKPTWDSWIMESKLEPYIHYLPLNDELDNLEELMSWAQNNDDKCHEIAKNGKMYMTQFFDHNREKDIQEKLLIRYSELFRFN